jgi:hypothetical protein
MHYVRLEPVMTIMPLSRLTLVFLLALFISLYGNQESFLDLPRVTYGAF